jgi:prepilin-type N-terminal cleavage/methylation domain-containing protein
MSTRQARAFTLIELLVVIIIIAIISAVVVPAYNSSYTKAKFDAEVRNIQDYFAQAREIAVKDDTTVTIHFEPGTHEFSMVADRLPPATDLPSDMLTTATQSSGSPDAAPYRPGDDYRIEGYNVSSNSNASVTTSPGVTRTDVQFHGDGSCDGLDFQVVSRQGYSTRLSLNPMSGRLLLGDAR